MAYTLDEIKDYIIENKSLVLATVDEKGNPQLRHLGGYNLDGNDILFLTTKGTGKTEDIRKHPRVAALFQHENQQVPKNITIYGEAEKLDAAEAEQKAEIIRKRRPQLKYNPESSEIYRIKVENIKILDFSGEEKISFINL